MTQPTPPSQKHENKPPTQIPKPIIIGLVVVNLLLGLAKFKGGYEWENWLAVFWQWLWLLVIIPMGVVMVALPLKWRDPSFQLRLAYYMGLFGACIYTLQAMRYLK